MINKQYKQYIESQKNLYGYYTQMYVTDENLPSGYTKYDLCVYTSEDEMCAYVEDMRQEFHSEWFKYLERDNDMILQ